LLCDLSAFSSFEASFEAAKITGTEKNPP